MTLLLAFAAAAFAWREMSRSKAWALLAFGWVLTGAPGILNFAAQWGVPMSLFHVIAGAGELLALAVFAFGPLALSPKGRGAPGPAVRRSDGLLAQLPA